MADDEDAPPVSVAAADNRGMRDWNDVGDDVADVVVLLWNADRI